MNERYPHAARLAAAVVLSMPSAGEAVTLDPDGLGQALVYPYYTVQSSRGNPFNTYLSVVNHGGDAKAVRVRLREGRLAKEVASFNVFLAPNDVWVAAVVPTNDGARVLSSDASCTDPPFGAGIDLRGDAYRGDGAGDGLDRAREGFVEIIEMATLTGANAAAVTHNSAGVPANCAAVVGNASAALAAPTGGLSGTLTLINVASGMDFTVNAEALADLATSPFYRLPADTYPDFNAAEIRAVSVVESKGAVYRSNWARPVDAVSAVLMRDAALAEFVLDTSTRSLTDMVMTFPTKHFYASRDAVAKPFTAPLQWSANCAQGSSDSLGERILGYVAPRSGGVPQPAWPQTCSFDPCPPPGPPPAACGANAVFRISNGAAHMPVSLAQTAVLGSVSRGYFGGGSLTYGGGALNTPVYTTQNGWVRMQVDAASRFTSLDTSTRVDAATGTTTTGAHTFIGLPMVGMAVRTFENGTLTCDAGRCQGNYGGAFPFKYQRTITP